MTCGILVIVAGRPMIETRRSAGMERGPSHEHASRESISASFLRSSCPLILLVMHQPSHAGEPSPALNREQASAFARLALKGLSKEYPNKPEHVMAGPADVKAPRHLHPAFYGSYDWHSSVHGHWMLVRLLRLFPDLKEAPEIRAVLGAHLTAENLKAEADYFARKESKSFERPYGWAWLLKLAQELQRLGRPGRESRGRKTCGRSRT